MRHYQPGEEHEQGHVERADYLIDGVALSACAERHQMTNDHQQDGHALQPVDILDTVVHDSAWYLSA